MPSRHVKTSCWPPRCSCPRTGSPTTPCRSTVAAMPPSVTAATRSQTPTVTRSQGSTDDGLPRDREASRRLHRVWLWSSVGEVCRPQFTRGRRFARFSGRGGPGRRGGQCTQSYGDCGEFLLGKPSIGRVGQGIARNPYTCRTPPTHLLYIVYSLFRHLALNVAASGEARLRAAACEIVPSAVAR